MDVKRAYGRWLKRRLLWIVPSLVLSCTVGLHLLLHPGLSSWVRIPSLTLATGVISIFMALAAQTLLVAREKSRGRHRQAQLLRKELRPYPGIGLLSLLLLLALMRVPSLFPEPPPVRVPVVHRRAGPTIAANPALPAVVPAAPSAPAAEAPAPPPQIVPEIARPPELPLLWDDLWPPPRPIVREDPEPGMDRFGMKHRPGVDDSFLSEFAGASKPFDRAGLPSEFDAESWQPPELDVEVMLVARSGLWRGGAMETSFDLPFGRDDSLRLTYLLVVLTDQEKLDGIQPNFGWQRGTLEYVRRLAGHERQSTFDLAFRIGFAIDHLRIREGDLRYDISFRYSPWVGVEAALWEDDGVGMIVQAGHSFATRLGGSTSSVTDLKAVVRINLGERSSVELGYRILSVRFRDQVPDEGELVDRMSQAFMGPIAGLAVRF